MSNYDWGLTKTEETDTSNNSDSNYSWGSDSSSDQKTTNKDTVPKADIQQAVDSIKTPSLLDRVKGFFGEFKDPGTEFDIKQKEPDLQTGAEKYKDLSKDERINKYKEEQIDYDKATTFKQRFQDFRDRIQQFGGEVMAGGIQTVGQGLGAVQTFIGENNPLFSEVEKAIKETTGRDIELPNVGDKINHFGEELQKQVGPEKMEFMDQVMQGVGSTLPYLAGGVAGKAFGVASNILNLGMSGMEALQNSYQDYNDLKNAGDPNYKTKALGSFAGNLALNYVTNKLGFLEGGINKSTKDVLKKFLVSAGMETGQETAQQLISNITQGKDPTDQLSQTALVSAPISILFGFGGVMHNAQEAQTNKGIKNAVQGMSDAGMTKNDVVKVISILNNIHPNDVTKTIDDVTGDDKDIQNKFKENQKKELERLAENIKAPKQSESIPQVKSAVEDIGSKFKKALPGISPKELEGSAGQPKIIPTKQLRTFDFNELEGKPQTEEQNKKIHNNIINHPEKPMTPTGESFDKASKRGLSAVKSILDTPGNKVITTHNSMFGLIDLWNKEGQPETLDKAFREKYTSQDNHHQTGDSFEIKGPKGDITVVRHGETEDNAAKLFRRAEAKLTDKGIDEAHALADTLKGKKIDAIYSSDLPRAIETSKIIQGKQGIEPKFNEKTSPEGRKELPEVPTRLERVKEYQDRLKLRGADPELVNTIITKEGGRAYGVSVGGTISFEKVVQQFTEDHEVFHQVFKNFENMRLFKNFDKKALLDEAKDLYGDLSDSELEEEMAKDFQQYVHEQETGKQTNFFGKILEFFQRLYASFKRFFRNENDIKEFYRTMREEKATEETKINNEMPAAFNKQVEDGVLDFRIQNDVANFLKETPVEDVFKDNGDLTLKTITKLEGRTVVSKQFILDSTNSPGITQPERDLVRAMLETEGDKVNVKEFADKLKAELLPLETLGDTNPRGDRLTQYEHVSLPDDLKGNVADYSERIYHSPIKVSAGEIHFGNAPEFATENYFGHTRIEDMTDSTRRVIEIQSDLFQKGNLDRESMQAREILDQQESYKKMGRNDINENETAEFIREEAEQRLKDVARLEQYNNPTAHFRMAREEIRKAGQDGKTRLLFPTGETAMKIEGLGQEGDRFSYQPTPSSWDSLKDGALKVGLDIVGPDGNWIITDVLGDGKFKAIPKRNLDEREMLIISDGRRPVRDLTNYEETFDISGKIDTNNPIYKFYEKEMSRYLKNNYNATPFTDDKGVTWMEVPIQKAYGELPVPAFNKKEKEISMGPKDITQAEDMARRADNFDDFNAMLRAGDQSVMPFYEEGKEIKVTNPNYESVVYRIKMDGYTSLEDFYFQNKKTKPTRAQTIESIAGPMIEKSKIKESKLKEILTPEIIAEKVKSIPKADAELSPSLQDKKYQLDGLNNLIKFNEERLEDSPGKKLVRFISRKEGTFMDFRDPTKAKTDSEKKTIIENNNKIIQEAQKAFEGTKWSDRFSDPDAIREAIDEYKELKEEQKSLKIERIKFGQEFRTQRNEFLLAQMDRKSISSIIRKEERLNAIQVAIKELRKEGRDRNQKISAIADFFAVSDKDMRKITGKKNFNIMSDQQFENYLKELTGKVEELATWNEARMEIDNIAYEMDFDMKNVENLREAMSLKKYENMSINDLESFAELLQTFEKGDRFLGKRQIQTVRFTDMAGIKTRREALEFLAKATGKPIKELQEINITDMDHILPLMALRDKHPFLAYFVDSVMAAKINAEVEMDRKINEAEHLIKEARKSRQKISGFWKNVIDKLIPTDDIIFDYLESVENKELREEIAKSMTVQEYKAARYIKDELAEMGQYLLDQNQLLKLRKAYITHIRRSFLEVLKTSPKGKFGFFKAVKIAINEIFEHKLQQEGYLKIMESKTEEILPLEKKFKYTFARTGTLTPSKNVFKAFKAYTKTFYKKKMLDSIVSKIDILAHVLTPPGKTERGVYKNDSLQKFIKKQLNTIRGRKTDAVPGLIPEGGRIDNAIRSVSAIVRYLYLGINIPGGLSSNVGAQEATYTAIGSKKYAIGIQRSLTKQGEKIAVKYKSIVGETAFQKMQDAAKDIGDKILESTMILWNNADRRAKKIFLLGMLTPEEFKTGEVSNEKLLEIQKQIAKFFKVEGLETTLGATSTGKVFTGFKTWAIPLATTTIRNGNKVIKMIKNGENPYKTPEGRELIRMFIVTALFMLLGYKTYKELKNKKDKGMWDQLVYKSIGDGLSIISSLNPEMYSTAPTLQFIGGLITSLTTMTVDLATGNRTATGQIGGLTQLKSAITPQVVKQLFGTKTEDDKIMSSISDASGTANQKLKDIDPAIVDKATETWNEVKKFGTSSKEANAITHKLSKDVYTAYQLVKTSDNDYWTEIAKKITPLAKEAHSLKEEDKKKEADALTASLTKDEYAVYNKIKKSLYEPDESGSNKWAEQTFIQHVANLAKGWTTDPATAFDNLIHGDWEITELKNGQIIVNRMPQSASDAIKAKAAKKNAEFKLDHIIPIASGGTNRLSNLKIVKTATWKDSTKVEDYISKALREDKITGRQAREYIIRYKGAKAEERLTPELMKEFTDRYHSQTLTFQEIKDLIGE